jgi:Mn2+/Fe2+ NRAMP family transporter
VKGMRLELLQWFGFLAAPLAWAGQLVLGYFFAEAHCEATRWASGWSSTEIGLTAGAAAVAVAAELAAAAAWLELRRVHEDAPGRRGRQHLLLAGALVANVLFLIAILMSGVGTVGGEGCRPA